MTKRAIVILLSALAVNALYKMLFCDDPDSGINPAIDGLFGLVATVLAAYGCRRASHPFRTVAILFTLYLAGTTVGYAVDFALVVLDWDREYPSEADAAWIAALLPYLFALPLLARKLIARLDLPTVVDGLLFTISISVSFGMLIVLPVLTDEDPGSLLLRVVSFAYPAVDVVALIAVAVCIVRTQGRAAFTNLISVSATLLAFADCLLSLGALEQHFPAMTAIVTDVLYDASYAVLGFAILRVQHANSQLEALALDNAGNRHHIAALTLIPLLVPLTLLIVDVRNGIGDIIGKTPIQLQVAIAASVVMFVLTSIRMGMLLRTQEKMTEALDTALGTLREQGEALRQAQKMEAIGRLAAGIAHEINTPAQYIAQNLEFVQRELSKSDITNDHLQEAVGDSLLGISRVAEIVGAVKTFGHPGTTDFAATDINDIMRSAISIAGAHIGDSASVITSLDESAVIECSPVVLHQVFLNLLVNAADAIVEAGPPGLINVTTEVVGENLVVAISDNGTGMSAEVANRIYEPMFTTKPVGKGTGMGLSLVWSAVVEQHHGNIECVSAVGAGTTITLTLPTRLQTGVSATELELVAANA